VPIVEAPASQHFDQDVVQDVALNEAVTDLADAESGDDDFKVSNSHYQEEDDYAIQAMIQNHLAQLRSYQASIRASMNATPRSATLYPCAPASEIHARPFLSKSKDRAEQFEQCKRRFREAALQRFVKTCKMKDDTPPKLVLIVGPSGCGKSTLATKLAESFCKHSGALSCSTIRQDEYFTQDFIDYAERQDDSFETAEHIDWVKLRADLRHAMSSSPIVIVEGHHLSSSEAGLGQLVSFAVIFEGNQGVSRSRRLSRRERSPKDLAVLTQYFDDYVWPAYLKYGKPAQDELRTECERRKCPMICVPGDDARSPDQLARVIVKALRSQHR
jgi:uridine kinase